MKVNEFAIELSGIVKSYDEVKAIDNLTLLVPENSVFGLVGPNGSGKTTLMQIIMGIIQPDHGDISILGENALKRGPELRNKIGYVPDVPYMYPSFTCAEMFYLASKLYSDWDWVKCRKLSELFEIPWKNRIKNLSRGFKTRIALVMALSIRPRLLLLDEPTAGIDPVIRQELRRVLIDEVAQNGTTVFYATHDLTELERTADQIAALERGRLLTQCSVDKIKESIHRVRVIFDKDQTPDIFKKMPELLEIIGHGRGFSLLVEGPWNEVESGLSGLGVLQIERLDVSLEESLTRLLKKGGGNEEKIY